MIKKCIFNIYSTIGSLTPGQPTVRLFIVTNRSGAIVTTIWRLSMQSFAYYERTWPTRFIFLPKSLLSPMMEHLELWENVPRLYRFRWSRRYSIISTWLLLFVCNPPSGGHLTRIVYTKYLRFWLIHYLWSAPPSGIALILLFCTEVWFAKESKSW